MIRELEGFAHERGYRRTVLMTRERMDYAIKLYEVLGYKRIENYHPYQHMDDAVCFAKDL
jgi:putative acetyltransferase